MIQLGNNALPIWLVAGLALVALVLLVLSYRPFRALVRVPALWSLGLARGLALLLLALLLLAPFLLQREPDPQGVRIAVLIDASGSMSTRDTLGDKPRLETALDLLAAEPQSPLLEQLRAQGKIDQYVFAGELFARPPRMAATDYLPGNSAIGDALSSAAVERQQSARALGGVLLISDGHENGGSTAATEAAKQFAGAGVPVSVIGVGEPGRRGDVKVEFTGERMNAVRGERISVPVRLESTFTSPRTIKLALTEGEDTLATREVVLAPGATETVQVEVAPQTAGLQVLRAAVEPVQGDNNPATDVDYLAMEVAEPLEVQVHWWASRPDWELRYLQRMVEQEEQLRLNSITRMGPGGWLVRNSGEDTGVSITAANSAGAPVESEAVSSGDVPPGIGDGRTTGQSVPLPWQDADLDNAAALVLDAELGPDLTEELQEKLRGLVENRGIGLLVYGDPAKLPEKLREILPVSGVEGSAVQAETVLQFDAGPVFQEDTASALESARLTVRAGDRIHTTQLLKPAARTLLSLPGGEAVLSIQAFGSGRIAYVGSTSTWRWFMHSQTGGEEHRAYWRGLAGFLGANTKSRVTPLLHGRQVSVDDPAQLQVDVLGSDFRPSTNARVSALLTRPDGESEKIALNPSLMEPGRYEAPLRLKGAGEFRVEYEVELPGNERLREQSFFTGSFSGSEMQDTSYEEERLRDLARITGGWFAHYRELGGPEPLPLRPDLPMVEKRVYLAQSWLYLGLVALLLGGEWIVRRRHGMK